MSRVILEVEVIQERKEIKVVLVWMVSKVLQVPLEIRVSQVHEVCQVSQDLRVPKDLKV